MTLRYTTGAEAKLASLPAHIQAAVRRMAVASANDPTALVNLFTRGVSVYDGFAFADTPDGKKLCYIRLVLSYQPASQTLWVIGVDGDETPGMN